MRCVFCGRTYSYLDKRVLCSCGGLLEIVSVEKPDVSWSVFRSRPFRLWRYRELIPIPSDAEIVSLGEGGTPLIKISRARDIAGIDRLYTKFEGSNPTGSFKDRGMSVAITIARYLGYRAAVCASTGNTAASMAAYARRAGIEPLVILPEGGVAKGKLFQVALHGARIVRVRGGFDNALQLVLKLVEMGIAYSLNSINPWRIEGQKTVVFEIVDEIGVPDWIALPVGNAGNITAVWKGLQELRDLGLIDRVPRLIGVQASGAAPLVKAYRLGLDKPVEVPNPETVATAIRIGRPVHGVRALRAVRQSGGVFIEVSDRDIVEAQKALARYEGIGVEPASATTIAGIKRLREEKILDRDELVVAILTGHALKDPETPAASISLPNPIGFEEALKTIDNIIRDLNRG